MRVKDTIYDHLSEEFADKPYSIFRQTQIIGLIFWCKLNWLHLTWIFEMQRMGRLTSNLLKSLDAFDPRCQHWRGSINVEVDIEWNWSHPSFAGSFRRLWECFSLMGKNRLWRGSPGADRWEGSETRASDDAGGDEIWPWKLPGLVNIQTTMENHHVSWENPQLNGHVQ